MYRRYLEFYVLESKLTEFHGKVSVCFRGPLHTVLILSYGKNSPLKWSHGFQGVHTTFLPSEPCSGIQGSLMSLLHNLASRFGKCTTLIFPSKHVLIVLVSFYIFTGSFPDAQLPSKRIIGPKNYEFLTSKREEFQEYLQVDV